MDPSFLRRQILSQQGMALTTSLPSGQSFYTLESLEGASSLPFLKPAPPASLPRRESLPTSQPVPLEHDLRLDAQTRALLADRDARVRLLAEREALLRNLPGGATALQDQRMYADALDARARAAALQDQRVYADALDARARVSLDGLQNFDVRSRTLLDNGRVLSHGLDARPGVSSLSDHRGLSHGLDMRPRDPLQPGVVNVSRAPPVVGGVAPGGTENGSLSELLRSRELGVGGHFLPAAGPALARRDIADWRAEAPNVGAQSARANGFREPPAIRSGPAEADKIKYQAERNKGLSSSQPTAKSQINPEQSEGWCAVCKIDCHHIKNLSTHIHGKKHKASLEQMRASKTADKQVNSAPSTSESVKKRASDVKAEMSQSTKRLKTSAPAITSNTPMVVSKDMKKAKDDSKKPTATNVIDNPYINNPYRRVCELCNISTTGKENLEAHMKGKRHAARVKELEDPESVVSAP